MKQTGDEYEALACHYLQQAGLVLLCQHFKFKRWEIDLVMQQGQTLVFVEVKYRKNSEFGGASCALSAAQINRLRGTAHYYLQRHHLQEQKTPCRFDLVAITGEASSYQIEWFKNAF